MANKVYIQNAKSIFNAVALNVRAEYQEGYVYLTRKLEPIPEQYPFCYMAQIENSSSGDLYKQGYEWQLSSNKIDGALDEIENIERIIVKTMLDMGYVLNFSREVSNLADSSITRKVLRFGGKVGVNPHKENSLYVYR